MCLSVGCLSCDWFSNPPSFSDDFVTYLIRADSHDAENTQGNLTIQGSNRMEFQAIFDESCIYTNRIPGNVHDINKLMGFADCGTIHHEASARFGWNWKDDALKIYTYVYVGGQRLPEKLMGEVALNKIHHFKLEVEGDKYIFTLNGHEEVMPRQCSDNVGKLAYKLYPYFGGDETAPHDIRIKIRMLK